MFSFFAPEEEETRFLIREHAQLVQQALEVFKDLVFAYLNEEEAYEDFAYEVQDLEHEADEIRREVERSLYRGAFFPMLREDYIKLVEYMDVVANRTQESSNMIVLERPRVTSSVVEDVKELTREVATTYRPMPRLIESLDRGDREAGLEFIHQIRSGERSVDDVEWQVIRQTFRDEKLTLAQKIHLRDLVTRIASISDQMERVADRGNIILTKRNL